MVREAKRRGGPPTRSMGEEGGGEGKPLRVRRAGGIHIKMFGRVLQWRVFSYSTARNSDSPPAELPAHLPSSRRPPAARERAGCWERPDPAQEREGTACEEGEGGPGEAPSVAGPPGGRGEGRKWTRKVISARASGGWASRAAAFAVAASRIAGGTAIPRESMSSAKRCPISFLIRSSGRPTPAGACPSDSARARR